MTGGGGKDPIVSDVCFVSTFCSLLFSGKVGELTITWKPLDPWNYNGPGIGYEVRWRDGDDYDEDWDGVSLTTV